eukprot:gene35257-biopygen33835
MAVMTASVHFADVHAAIGQAGLLLNGQRVHIGAQSQTALSSSRLQRCHQTGTTDAAMYFAAVTKAVRELEDDVGSALITRNARGIQLTDDGQRLLVRARLIVRQMQLAREELLQTQGVDAGSIAI